MDTLLEQIDTIKQSITDQQYRDIMDSMKVIHDTIPKEEESEYQPSAEELAEVIAEQERASERAIDRRIGGERVSVNAYEERYEITYARMFCEEEEATVDIKIEYAYLSRSQILSLHSDTFNPTETEGIGDLPLDTIIEDTYIGFEEVLSPLIKMWIINKDDILMLDNVHEFYPLGPLDEDGEHYRHTYFTTPYKLLMLHEME